MGNGSSAFLDKINVNPNIFKEIVENLTDPNALKRNEVLKIAQGDSGTRWIGTARGLNLFDLTEGKFQFFKPTSGGIHAICQEGENTLWYGVWLTGLYKHNLNTREEDHFPNLSGNPNNAPSSIIRRILLTQDGDLWVGIWEGLYRNNNTFFQSPKGKYLQIESLLEGRSGMIGIGTQHGLYLFDPEKNYLLKIFDIHINRLLKSRDGSIWIGTSSDGLWHYDPINKEVEKFTTRDRLANNSIFNLVEDRNGHLGIATGRETSRFLPEAKEFINYGFQDGISNRFSHWPSNAVGYSKNGDIYFGGNNGITRITTQEVQIFNERPKIVLTQL